MNIYVIASFYKFVVLEQFEAMKAPILRAMKEYDIKGTIILAQEGINGSFCGEKENIAHFSDCLKSFPALEDLLFCNTFHDRNPFAKSKVKLRPEIVTMGENGVSPNEMRGQYLTPHEWNEKLTDPDVVVIDTRNEYEVSLGAFEGAINPNTDNFRDFPAYVQQHLLDKKDKKIAMYCTGGIRCEKSTAYLKKMGFNDVYHLQGGILHYLEKMPAESSKWHGSCFVFDERVAVDSNLASLPRGSIDPEWKNNNKVKHKPDNVNNNKQSDVSPLK